MVLCFSLPHFAKMGCLCNNLLTTTYFVTILYYVSSFRYMSSDSAQVSTFSAQSILFYLLTSTSQLWVSCCSVQTRGHSLDLQENSVNSVSMHHFVPRVFWMLILWFALYLMYTIKNFRFILLFRREFLYNTPLNFYLRWKQVVTWRYWGRKPDICLSFKCTIYNFSHSRIRHLQVLR